MSHFEFEHPAILALSLLALCFWLCPVKKRELFFPHLHLFSKVATLINREKLLYATIFTLFIAALASPISYDAKLPNDKKGRDLVFVLDSSGSMNESGFWKEHPNSSKFEIVVHLFREFVSKRYDDNVGVVLFGTFAFSSVPITYDTKSLLFMTQFLEVGLAGQNTAIGDGLYEALTMLQNSKAKSKVIILLTDGYQNSGSHSIQAMVAKAKEMGVKIYTIGIGNEGDFDAKLLELIAKESGAKSFKAKSYEDLEEVYRAIDALEPSKIHSQNYLNKKALFAYPLFVALLLLLYLLWRRRS